MCTLTPTQKLGGNGPLAFVIIFSEQSYWQFNSAHNNPNMQELQPCSLYTTKLAHTSDLTKVTVIQNIIFKKEALLTTVSSLTIKRWLFVIVCNLYQVNNGLLLEVRNHCPQMLRGMDMYDGALSRINCIHVMLTATQNIIISIPHIFVHPMMGFYFVSYVISRVKFNPDCSFLPIG